MMLLRATLTVVLLFPCSSLVAAGSNRLTEQPITLPPTNVPEPKRSDRLTEQPITLPLPPTNGPEPKRISGYFKLNRTHDARMFYFLFQNRKLEQQAPVVLWMTGGPGCSSELAVFFENGPFHIRKNLTLELSEYGWDNVADLIYVDQPINTGFSYSDVCVWRLCGDSVCCCIIMHAESVFYTHGYYTHAYYTHTCTLYTGPP